METTLEQYVALKEELERLKGMHVQSERERITLKEGNERLTALLGEVRELLREEKATQAYSLILEHERVGTVSKIGKYEHDL